MARKKKVNIGDIFAIKLDHARYSYGQVVAEGSISDCMVVFDLVTKEHPAANYITSNPIIFIIQTVNSRIEDGHWEVIGNDTIPTINFPLYKADTENGYNLVNYKGEVINEYPSSSEIKEIKDFESWSPVCLEEAVKAKFVTGEWDSYYDDLIYKY
ncbi:immunity 26/phosphotriesterase HocA family protein [Paenibacillus glycanilyticus]|uniref:Imm26 family immunity protein n=1 Tax=Paenibacillus glycanilyticus TaxID=126569 RepID=UPI0020405A92|nr:Imm26 family immunity protein [Paenibacillus glycanilyticus]MCM3625753.1 immunity 26/phosphotriesterase HocA family protein [Paenibacillus glycanilyticus]